MAITLVQVAAASATDSTTVSATFPHPPGLFNTYFVVASNRAASAGTGGNPQFSDSNGNSFHYFTLASSGAWGAIATGSSNITVATPSLTVTVTWQVADNIDIVIAEFSGILVGGESSAGTTAPSSSTTGSAVFSFHNFWENPTPDELLLSYPYATAAGASWAIATAGWSLADQSANLGMGWSLADGITAPVPQTFFGTYTGGPVGPTVVGFAEAHMQGPPLPTIACGGPPPGTVGTFYSHVFPVTYSGTLPTMTVIAGALPPGLLLSGGIAVSGLAAEAGVFPFTLKLTDSRGYWQEVNCSITINPATPPSGGEIYSTYKGFTRMKAQGKSSAPAALAVQTPTGALNGTNTVFTLPTNPGTSQILLFLNGIAQLAGTDYTISGTSGTTITYATAPGASDWHEAYYVTGSGGGGGATPVVIGFVINSGSPGTNIGPMLAAPNAGSVSRCVIVTKASDPSTALTLTIRQNGVSVFSVNPTVAAGTASGTLSIVGTLTSTPLTVSSGDVFSIDITSGSATWQFTAQLE